VRGAVAVRADGIAAWSGLQRRRPLSDEARQQAQAEGLTLRQAESKTGYFGVCLAKPGQRKP